MKCTAFLKGNIGENIFPGWKSTTAWECRTELARQKTKASHRPLTPVGPSL
jgi:hypothetical protein